MSINISVIENLAKEAAELEFSSDTLPHKQKLWIEMGKELEAANYDKEKIATRIRSMIDKHLKVHYQNDDMQEKSVKFNSGYFTLTMRIRGWTNPEKNHSNSVAGQLQLNSSTFNEQVSSCYEERMQDIILLDRFKKLFDSLINELYIEYDEVKVGDSLTTKPRDWTKYYDGPTIKLHQNLRDIMANMVDEWNQSIDKRYSLLPKMKLVAPCIVRAIATTSAFCSRHYTILKSKTQISPKTYKKFMEDVKSYSDYLKILQVGAWKYYALPVPCPDCSEYTLRTRLNSDGTWHFVCVNKIAHKEGQPEYPSAVLKEQINKIIQSPREARKLLKYYNYKT
ncbi:MAG: hypothetical protein O6761_06835 [Thaumarchaeota archaeon]|nr:hypothetical protein [Nitrososphaerota archaeon]